MSGNLIQFVSPAPSVRLEFTGTLATGAYVVLEVHRNGQMESRQLIDLPPLPNLDAETTEHWQTYRQLSNHADQRSRMQWEAFYEKPQTSQIEDCHQSADRLLLEFDRWLERDEMRPLITQLRTCLNPSDRAHFSIVASDPQIEQLPWQKWSLFQDYPHIEPALSSHQLLKCPTFEALDRPRSSARILAVFGDDTNLDTTVDRQALEQAIRDTTLSTDAGSDSDRKSPQARPVEIEFLETPTRAELESALHEQDWDILFFAGHSRTEADSGRIFISATESVTIDQLWYSLHQAVDRGLRLAIFNSCQGLGIAKGLNTARIPQMVIMREAVPDRVAQAFLRYFLHGFVRRRLPLTEAVRDARQRLAHLEADHPCATWLPTLYQHPEADVLTIDRLITARTESSESSVSPESSEPAEPATKPSGDSWWNRHRHRVTQRRILIPATVLMVMVVPILWWATAFTAGVVGSQAFRQKHFDRAVLAFKLQAWLMPQAGAPRYNLAQVYNQRLFNPDHDRATQAIELMQAAAARKFAMAYPEWARLLLDRGELQRAIAVIDQGFAVLAGLSPETPNDAEIKAGLYTQRAWWALQVGQFDDADRDAKQVIELFPEGRNPKAWCVVARVQVARRQDAREAWQRVYEQSDRRLLGQQDCWLAAKAYLNEHPLRELAEKSGKNP